MRDPRITIALFITALFLMKLWQLAPDGGGILKPYVYSDQEISRHTHLWFVALYGMMVFILLVIDRMAINFRSFWFTALLFQVGMFFEYVINYNEAWFKLVGMDINLSNIRFFVLTGMAIYHIHKWSSSQSR